MRRPGGYGVLTDANGKQHEHDSFTCSHCQRIVAVKPFMDPAAIGGLCYVCSKHICPQCVGQPCDEIQRKLDRWEASYNARKSYGLEGY